jgi:hypothetical protein
MKEGHLKLPMIIGGEKRVMKNAAYEAAAKWIGTTL